MRTVIDIAVEQATAEVQAYGPEVCPVATMIAQRAMLIIFESEGQRYELIERHVKEVMARGVEPARQCKAEQEGLERLADEALARHNTHAIQRRSQ